MNLQRQETVEKNRSPKCLWPLSRLSSSHCRRASRVTAPLCVELFSRKGGIAGIGNKSVNSILGYKLNKEGAHSHRIELSSSVSPPE